MQVIADFMCYAANQYIPADVVFSTAHKSKGLEFDTVKLVDDYCQTVAIAGSSVDPYGM